MRSSLGGMVFGRREAGLTDADCASLPQPGAKHLTEVTSPSSIQLV